MKTPLIIAILVTSVLATLSPWEQCGGSGYSGDTACPSGYSCNVVNQWYSQCQLGASATTTTSATSTTTTTTTTSVLTSSGGKLKWVGVDESGMEWGTTYPGTEGYDYFVPSTTTIGVGFGSYWSTLWILSTCRACGLLY